VVLPPLVGAVREAKQVFERSITELRENEAVERRRFAEEEEERRKDRAEWEQREAASQRREAERREARQATHAAEALARERLLEERLTAQASDRAPFEALFSEEFLSAERQRGVTLDLCGLCRQPYWIPRKSLVDWSLSWRGPPRCRTCYCPPLTARVRRENPAWTPLRVSHEIVMAIWDHGPYAWAVELSS
jgi:hypothetical protein